MSLRHLRKLVGPNTLPPPDDSSEEEYEPLYAKKSTSNFQGLVLSSNSEPENDSEAVAADSPEPEMSCKKKKKKKKKKQKQQNAESVPQEDEEELDEIDKSVREVNALLGAPPPAPPPVEKPPPDPKRVLFSCQQKYLNEANEVFSSYHPDPSEPKAKRRGRSHEANRMLKRAVIIPITEATIKFPKSGLSMSLISRDENCKYFAFDHSKEYQARHRLYLGTAVYGRETPMISLEELRKHMHIESLLESADFMFRREAYSEAKTVVEYAVAYMQHVVHSMFNFTDSRVRLEYKYTENRPFHIAVLKYLHLLSNKACHRTALELAKLLLNLDPSDPLGVLFIIDTLALRARQHQWLIDAIDYMNETRDAGILYNMQYSKAMAHFHVATKSKADLSQADNLLQDAILRFPTLALNLLELAGVKVDKVGDCELFQTAEKSTPKFLTELIGIYAKFTVSRWREPPVLEWFKRNVGEVADRFSKDKDVVQRAHDFRVERMTLFQGRPGEIMRHLSIIQPMGMLLIESEIAPVPNCRNVDPFPPEGGISRFGYGAVNNAIAETLAAMNSPLFELFTSILPHYDLPIPRQVERNLMEVRREAEAIAGEEARNNIDEDQFEFVPDQYDMLYGDDDSTDDDENGEQARFVVSVGALTEAVRRLIGIHERGNSSTDPDNPQPGQSSDPELPIEEVPQEGGAQEEMPQEGVSQEDLPEEEVPQQALPQQEHPKENTNEDNTNQPT